MPTSPSIPSRTNGSTSKLARQPQRPDTRRPHRNWTGHLAKRPMRDRSRSTRAKVPQRRRSSRSRARSGGRMPRISAAVRKRSRADRSARRCANPQPTPARLAASSGQEESCRAPPRGDCFATCDVRSHITRGLGHAARRLRPPTNPTRLGALAGHHSQDDRRRLEHSQLGRHCTPSHPPRLQHPPATKACLSRMPGNWHVRF
jgi:hypothetical protein